MESWGFAEVSLCALVAPVDTADSSKTSERFLPENIDCSLNVIHVMIKINCYVSNRKKSLYNHRS
jgi:hypothetical protein